MKETTKTIALVVALLLLLGGAYFYFQKPDLNLGNVGSTPFFGYSGATNTSATCSGATSSVIVAAQLGRTSFSLSVGVSTTPVYNAVYVCRAAKCSKFTGLALGTTSLPYYQTDSYVGAYSCITVTDATSTLMVSYSQ